ncbi:S-layer homology domain-containing protein [Geitlerinema sp. PCC 9228]|uniref:S-layer homology domain-containing protein n=1 Tax=Geitlerinema sp. PCC 9228 TaxID=111611 RepID=UPI0008F9A18A|nr:S-layer homology domain-containing protein [Geitlerinema sp. PCC 9228]
MSPSQRHQQVWNLLRKLIAGSAVGVVLGSLGTNIALAQERFADLQGHWASECINRLANNRMIRGYRDNTFRPNEPVMRVELAVVLQTAFPNREEKRESIDFVDIPQGYWAESAIRYATRTGFLQGFPEKIFKPAEPLSKAEVLMALSNGLELEASQPVEETLSEYFQDVSAIPDYAQNAIAAAVEAGLLDQLPQDKQLAANDLATRAEVASFLCQALQIASPSETVEETPETPPESAPATIPTEAQPSTAVEETPETPPESAPATTPTEMPTESKTASSENGEVTATLTYEKQQGLGTNFQLQIERQGETLPAQSVPLLQGEQARLMRMRVVDVSGDAEPEILVDLYSGGMRCCHYSLVYQHKGEAENYTSINHYWGNVGYDLLDLDGDGRPEFRSADDRFAYEFAKFDASGFPIQIWQYRDGKMVNVTPEYPQQIYADAYKWWEASYKNLQSTEDKEVKGYLAAYLANMYHLGASEKGWQVLKNMYDKEDKDEFFHQLSQFLEDLDYSR